MRAGRNYLIQHSAGSGKSNSIAWLSHRLSGLHNDNNEKIFKSVIVVTDRKVLDNQLQDTIFQFDHKLGVVEKIDKDSAQLKDATFERIFEQQFKDIAALRYEQNEEFFVRMFKDEDFMGEVIKLLLPEVYRKLRKKGA